MGSHRFRVGDTVTVVRTSGDIEHDWEVIYISTLVDVLVVAKPCAGYTLDQAMSSASDGTYLRKAVLIEDLQKWRDL